MKVVIALILVLSLTGLVYADTPTTQPAAPTVLIIPFQQLGDTTAHLWVGPALQESLISVAARSGAVQTKAMPQNASTSDPGVAMRDARDNNASIVVFG